MTNEQLKLVQDSFRKIAPIAETAAQLFYARLFELDPDLELLFKGNLSEQGRKLMQMLGIAVNSLDRMDQRGAIARHTTRQLWGARQRLRHRGPGASVDAAERLGRRLHTRR